MLEVVQAVGDGVPFQQLKKVYGPCVSMKDQDAIIYLSLQKGTTAIPYHMSQAALPSVPLKAERRRYSKKRPEHATSGLKNISEVDKELIGTWLSQYKEKCKRGQEGVLADDWTCFVRNCGEYEYWLPWQDVKNIGGRFDPSVNVGDKQNPKKDYVQQDDDLLYGVRWTSTACPLPTIGDLTIVPPTAWDKAPNWSIADIPNSLQGNAARALGRYLKDMVPGMPISASMPTELESVLCRKDQWVPGIKAAVVWLWCFLIRFHRYMVWPNAIFMEEACKSHTQAWRKLGYFGLQAAYNRIHVQWCKHQRQRSYSTVCGNLALYEAHCFRYASALTHWHEHQELIQASEVNDHQLQEEIELLHACCKVFDIMWKVEQTIIRDYIEKDLPVHKRYSELPQEVLDFMDQRFSEPHEPLPDDPSVGEIQLRVGLIQGQPDDEFAGEDALVDVEDQCGMSIEQQHQPGLPIGSQDKQRAETSNPNQATMNQREPPNKLVHASKRQRVQYTHDNQGTGVGQSQGGNNVAEFSDCIQPQDLLQQQLGQRGTTSVQPVSYSPQMYQTQQPVAMPGQFMPGEGYTMGPGGMSQGTQAPLMTQQQLFQQHAWQQQFPLYNMAAQQTFNQQGMLPPQQTQQFNPPMRQDSARAGMTIQQVNQVLEQREMQQGMERKQQQQGGGQLAQQPREPVQPSTYRQMAKIPSSSTNLPSIVPLQHGKQSKEPQKSSQRSSAHGQQLPLGQKTSKSRQQDKGHKSTPLQEQEEHAQTSQSLEDTEQVEDEEGEVDERDLEIEEERSSAKANSQLSGRANQADKSKAHEGHAEYDYTLQMQPIILVGTPYLKRVRCVLQKCERGVAGGEGVVGLYGTIRLGGLLKIMRALFTRSPAELGPIHLHDVGAGIGNVLAASLLVYGVTVLSGVEIDSLKIKKCNNFMKMIKESVMNCQQLRPKLEQFMNFNVVIEEGNALNSVIDSSVTHVYSFCAGMQDEIKMHVTMRAVSQKVVALAFVDYSRRISNYIKRVSQAGIELRVVFDQSVNSKGTKSESFRAVVLRRGTTRRLAAESH